MKRLVVNADDFGFTSDVNEGILQSHCDGIVRSASLMANGSAFDDAVAISRRHPALGVGCHLTLVQGESLARPGTRLSPTVLQLLATGLPVDFVLAEFRAQVEAVLACGIQPTHLDTHKHIHCLPRLLDVVAQVADEFAIRWLRKPFDVPLGWAPPLRTVVSLAMRPFRIPFEERLRRCQCRTADYFAGFRSTGTLSAPQLVSLLGSLPDGLGEFVCHPGICGSELLRADTRLKHSREVELRALCSAEVKRAARLHGISLVSYREI